jgi:hypothetical protein
MDWLSGLFEMMPVRGRLDLRCAYGTPWRIDQGPGEANEVPYHAVLAGSATLEDPAGGRPLLLKTGDELKRSSLSTGAVAEAVGYQSEAAFQRAFKGHMGVTPAQWRKMQEPSGRDVFARPAAAADAKTTKTAEAPSLAER